MKQVLRNISIIFISFFFIFKMEIHFGKFWKISFCKRPKFFTLKIWKQVFHPWFNPQSYQGDKILRDDLNKWSYFLKYRLTLFCLVLKNIPVHTPGSDLFRYKQIFLEFLGFALQRLITFDTKISLISLTIFFLIRTIYAIVCLNWREILEKQTSLSSFMGLKR